MFIGSRFRRIAIPALAILLVLAFSAVAHAATFQVNTTDDTVNTGGTTCSDSSGKCSLRAAVDAANNNPSDDVIMVPSGRYDRTIAPAPPNDNSTGDFNVASVSTGGKLTIQGQTGDPKDVIVSAAGLDRVIEVDTGGDLTVRAATLQDGYTGSAGAGINVAPSGSPCVGGGGTTTDTTTGTTTQTSTETVTSTSTVTTPEGCGPQQSPSVLTIDHARVIKNVTTDDSGGGIEANNSGATTITVENGSNVDRNTAWQSGGGIDFAGTGSKLTVLDSTVDGNATDTGSGGGIADGARSATDGKVPSGQAQDLLHETLHIERGSVSDNQSTQGNGGGIYVFCFCGDSDTQLIDSNVDHNFAYYTGGGIANGAGSLDASGTSFDHNEAHEGSGGGIAVDFLIGLSQQQSNPLGKFTATTTLTDVSVHGNVAHDYGGGVYSSYFSGDTSISHSSVDSNTAQNRQGGGVYNDGRDLSVTDSHVDHNKADYEQGGGIANTGGSLNVLRTSVDSNSAGTQGYEDCNCIVNNTGRGGGIYSAGASPQRLALPGLQTGTTITDTSISKNHSFLSGGGLWDRTGATIINTTVADNVSDVSENGHDGAGIFDHNGGQSLINDTIAGNVATDGAGGGYYGNSDVGSQAVNTIIADNQANNGGNAAFSDCGGFQLTSNGHNLDGFQSNQTAGGDQCGFDEGVNGDQTKKDARLGPLQDNGGPTLTRALLDDSPAIDTADDSVCTDPNQTNSHDQRQAHRPAGPHCDIGAYEAHALADLSISKTASPNPVVVGQNETYTIHATNNGPDSLLSGVVVSDPLPGNVTLVSATPSQGTCDTTVSCNLGGLAAGSTATVTIVVHPTTAGPLSNTATVSGAPTDPDGSNNSATANSTAVPPGAGQQVAGQQICNLGPPRSSISRNGLFARSTTIRLVGRTIDLICPGTKNSIRSVQVAIGQSASGGCRFVDKSGSLSSVRSCKKPILFKARRGKERNGKVPWTFRLRHLNLAPGSYFALVRGRDAAGRVETAQRRYNFKRFKIR